MLRQTIQKDLNEAMKEKNEIVRNTLRMLLAAILNREKEKKYKEKIEGEPRLTDEELVEVVFSEIKKRKDAVVMFKEGKRPELAEKEEKEIEVLQKYLPEQLSEEELKKIVKEAVDKIKAKEMKDMGKIMAEIMPKIKGKADGNQVSKIVKEILTKQK